MGWGDELMIAGEARRLHSRYGGKVRVVSEGGTQLYSPLWDRISYIAQPGDRAEATIIDSPRCRPYRSSFDDHGSVWREYGPYPAEICFTDSELRFAEQFGSGFVVVEPHVKSNRDGSSNRQWGWGRYAELVSARPNLRWVQLSEPSKSALPGVIQVRTHSFRLACAVLSRAAALVGPEGGLHHASAAVGIPAVIIFGGYISPEVTGYRSHVNVFTGCGLGCGKRNQCECSCMQSINPSQIVESLDRTLVADGFRKRPLPHGQIGTDRL